MEDKNKQYNFDFKHDIPLIQRDVAAPLGHDNGYTWQIVSDSISNQSTPRSRNRQIEIFTDDTSPQEMRNNHSLGE